jgi:hypothetical protein
MIETLEMIRLVFGEESMGRTRVFEGSARFRADQKKARQVRSKVKSMLNICFDIMGVVHKEFVLPGQTVNSAYFCDILWRLSENL